MLEAYYRELHHFLSRRVGNRDVAADLVQESYTRVFAAANGHAIAEPRALLYATARNLLIDRHRRDQVRGGAACSTETPGEPEDMHETVGPDTDQPDRILAGRQRLAVIESVLASLPPRPREAFVLSKIDGLSRAEVAQIMGVGVRTVESHLEVAMRACQEALQTLDHAEQNRAVGR